MPALVGADQHHLSGLGLPTTLPEGSEKAITMARSRNDYVPAFKFAETLEATARDYVKGRLQEARDADLRAAMMTAEPSESGGDVESFFNAVDAQEVPQPCMDAFA